MKSPVTGKEMSLKREIRNLAFRKEEFPVVFHYYLCEDSGEQFTSIELDELNLKQLYNQYRDKHNLPFPEQVRETREKYGLSASRMSEVLGFGINSYRNYENDEVPSHSNGKLIQLAKDPRHFKNLIEISEELDETFKSKILKKIDGLILEIESNPFAIEFEGYLLDGRLPDEYSGYKKPSLSKLTEMIVYFTHEMKPWKTQMNKLLFYADFLNFKKYCNSISGVRYRAINMGPVLCNYESVFEYLANKNEIDVTSTEFQNGSIGDHFEPRIDRPFNNTVFSVGELESLETVAKKFKGLNTKSIIDISHKEKGWLENQADKKLISYKYAFYLNQI